MTAGQMLGYDATKTLLKSRDVRDSPVLHVVAATVAALTAATLAAPADALQTRYQSSLGTGAASTESVHECARRMLLREGPRVFFRGWTAQFIRLVGTFTLGTTVYEQTRRLLGLGFLD